MAWGVHGVEDSYGPPALRAAAPETAMRLFQEWPSAGRRKIAIL